MLSQPMTAGAQGTALRCRGSHRSCRTRSGLLFCKGGGAVPRGYSRSVRATSRPGPICSTKSIPIAGRLPIPAVLTNLESWVEQTRDPDLRTVAARNVSPGSFGVLDYAMQTAPTLRSAVELGNSLRAPLQRHTDTTLEQRPTRVLVAARALLTGPAPRATSRSPPGTAITCADDTASSSHSRSAPPGEGREVGRRAES